MSWVETNFSNVGARCDPIRSDPTPRRTHELPQHLNPEIYAYLLSITLEIGFRRVTSSCDQPTLHLDHTSRHECVFETAFSSDDDEVVADAVSIWVVGSDSTLPGSCARYLANRVERGTPFSPRLLQASICALECKEFEASGSEIVLWLNHLSIGADEMVEKHRLARLLVGVIRSPTGLERLSSHYWHSLDKVVVASGLNLYLTSRDTEVMRSLERAEDWEKLGVWMVVARPFLPHSSILIPESMEGIEEVARKSLLRRPSVLQGFEDLCEAGTLSYQSPAYRECRIKLQRICDQA